MPLKKYNTTTGLLTSSSALTSSCSAHKLAHALSNEQSEQNVQQIGSPTTSKRCGATLANQISSLSELLPNTVEAAASYALNASSGSASATITPCSNRDTATIATNSSSHTLISVLPGDIKHRLHAIFAQIEREFDALYAENIRLHAENTRLQQLKVSAKTHELNGISENESTPGLMASHSKDMAKTNGNQSSNSTSSNDSSPKSATAKHPTTRYIISHIVLIKKSNV